jgi:hypothetical protein
VPEDSPARYELYLENRSPTRESEGIGTYSLQVNWRNTDDRDQHLSGAAFELNGVGGTTWPVPRHNFAYGTTTVTLTLRRGESTYSYCGDTKCDSGSIRLVLSSDCDDGALYTEAGGPGRSAGAWISAEFVRPCNQIEWSRVLQNQGSLTIDSYSLGILPVTMVNPHKDTMPLAKRKAVDRTFNPNLKQVQLLFRCVAVACAPEDREWMPVTLGRGRLSSILEGSESLEKVRPRPAPRA